MNRQTPISSNIGLYITCHQPVTRGSECSNPPFQGKKFTSIQESLRLSKKYNAIQQKLSVLIGKWGIYLAKWKDSIGVLRPGTTYNSSAQQNQHGEKDCLTGATDDSRKHEPYQTPDLVTAQRAPRSYHRVGQIAQIYLLLGAESIFPPYHVTKYILWHTLGFSVLQWKINLHALSPFQVCCILRQKLSIIIKLCVYAQWCFTK